MSQDGTERPTGVGILFDDDAPEECDNCPNELKTIAYVNGQTLCGRCYGWKMGYFKGEPEYPVDPGNEDSTEGSSRE